MDTPHFNLLHTINQAISHAEKDVDYWKAKQGTNRKIIKKFIQGFIDDSQNSLNDLIELREMLTVKNNNHE